MGKVNGFKFIMSKVSGVVFVYAVHTEKDKMLPMDVQVCLLRLI